MYCIFFKCVAHLANSLKTALNTSHGQTRFLDFWVPKIMAKCHFQAFWFGRSCPNGIFRLLGLTHAPKYWAYWPMEPSPESRHLNRQQKNTPQGLSPAGCLSVSMLSSLNSTNQAAGLFRGLCPDPAPLTLPGGQCCQPLRSKREWSRSECRRCKKQSFHPCTQ